MSDTAASTLHPDSFQPLVIAAKPTAATFARIALVAVLLAFAAAGPVRPALAGTPCWKTLLNDWYDGRIDKTYPVPCYREALAHLPPDVTTYSSARDDIQRELQSAITRTNEKPKPGTTTTKPPSSTSASGSGGGAAPAPAPAPARPTSTATTGTSGAPRPPSARGEGRTQKGGFAKAADRFNPGSADSLPLPLLVLAAFAVLLIAAGGAGALVRRRHG